MVNIMSHSFNGTWDDLYKVVRYIVEAWDFDMSGANGTKWKKAEGFDSNLDYLLDKYKGKCKDFEEFMGHFCYDWMGDDSYYEDYSIEFIRNCHGEYVALCIAVEVED